MNHQRINKLEMYHTPPSKPFQHSKSLERTNTKEQPYTDPLRQQLTHYLNQFRQQPASSNLLIANPQGGLPTLYAKARKYSVFTIKRKANRSFHSPYSRRFQILPSVRRIHI